MEGQNLHIDYRSADGQGERFPELVAELVRNRVDLIVTRGTPAARAAKAATATIPIVMAAIGEPLGVGVVASLAHPGGNVTGLSAFVTELSGKRIELLKETFPSVSTVGLLNNLGNPVAPPQWEATRAVASQLRLTAELFDVRSEADIVQAFSTMVDKRLGALANCEIAPIRRSQQCWTNFTLCILAHSRGVATWDEPASSDLPNFSDGRP